MTILIVTPSRNSGQFIGDAIASVLGQSVAGHTVLHRIQDGMSTDNTRDVLDAFACSGLEVRREADAGLSDALNKALIDVPPEVDIVGWLNADEFYRPGVLRKVASVFEKRPDVDIVFGDTLHVDEHGRRIRLLAQHRFTPASLANYGAFIQTGSTFYRRALLDDGSLWLDRSLKQSMDYDLFMRLALEGRRFLHIPMALSCFRLHGEQLSRVNPTDLVHDEHSLIRDRYGMFESYRKGLVIHRVEKLRNGAYFREFVARLRRPDERWWLRPGSHAPD